MKAQKKLLLTGAISMALLVSIPAMAQQKQVLPASASQKVMPANESGASYSFRLYKAPNNMYGYDIYKEGKPVYHQFVVLYVSKEGKRIIATKLQAQKAASAVIAKISKGQSPLLSGEELKKIMEL